MDIPALLNEAFGRILPTVSRAVDGLSADQLAARPDPEANSVAWLVWHLTRIQDDHIAEVAGTEQVWTADGWARRFDLPFDDEATGFGQRSEDVAAVRVDSPDLLTGYLSAVNDATTAYLAGLSGDDLDRVVDDRWDPPVTLGVRLTSVLSDDLQHAGQASYVRGLVQRSAGSAT
ncbi:MAG TPA: DUF664 domain-containing protein [Frankiaceae bacterium]|nr:DUF664 domain-containing protein [Frankiaceae bacterium]